MLVWRITRSVHAANPLSGEGSARSGNRWNSRGVRIGYTSSSRSLAVLEMLVHVTRDTLPPDIRLIAIEVPDHLITQLNPFPKHWNELPHSTRARAAGDNWVRSHTSLGLVVPSAVLAAEHNVLINPLHPDFRHLKILKPEADFLDQRLFS